MTAATAQAQHDRRIDYIEFPSTDLARTKDFYGSVFGWTFTDYGPAYTSFADGRLTGGFFLTETSPKPAQGGALVVIYARDLEGVRDQVLAQGGRIVKEIYEFPGGRRFHFADPSGNLLAVWSESAAG